jgi:hypothetical protein
MSGDGGPSVASFGGGMGARVASGGGRLANSENGMLPAGRGHRPPEERVDNDFPLGSDGGA